MHIPPNPPKITDELSWRSLYASGAFVLRELVPSITFNTRSRDRGVGLGVGDASLKHLHEVGALRPIAFSRVGYWSGFTSPSEPAEELTFADEQPGAWEDHQWEHVGRPTVTALYSPWQHLCTSDANKTAFMSVPLWVLLADAEKQREAVAKMRGWLEGQDAAWRELDEAWRPLLQTLVRLQNRYWPEVSERTTWLFDPETREQFDPFTAARKDFDAKKVLEHELGGDREGILAAYHFLLERGMNLDPHDGMTLLRRARPRAFHVRWRGDARRAQDHFDAAEVLRHFLRAVDGRPVPRPDAMPMDGRQPERERLYERGPAAPWDGAEVVELLQDAELYPHGVHVVHEGDSEQVVIEALVEYLLGRDALEEVAFTDLGGAGSAGLLEDLIPSLAGYARRTVVIVDSEAKAKEHVEALVAAGSISSDDVLQFETSFEEATVSREELVTLTKQVAAEHGIELKVTVDQLDAFHADQLAAATRQRREAPSVTTSLERLVQKSSRGWGLRKAELVRAIATYLVEEVHDQGIEGSSRAVVHFVVDRIIDPLNRPYPVGAA